MDRTPHEVAMAQARAARETAKLALDDSLEAVRNGDRAGLNDALARFDAATAEMWAALGVRS